MSSSAPTDPSTLRESTLSSDLPTPLPTNQSTNDPINSSNSDFANSATTVKTAPQPSSPPPRSNAAPTTTTTATAAAAAPTSDHRAILGAATSTTGDRRPSSASSIQTTTSTMSRRSRRADYNRVTFGEDLTDRVCRVMLADDSSVESLGGGWGAGVDGAGEETPRAERAEGEGEGDLGVPGKGRREGRGEKDGEKGERPNVLRRWTTKIKGSMGK